MKDKAERGRKALDHKADLTPANKKKGKVRDCVGRASDCSLVLRMSL